ncbi:MAG TPA: hypothetical protein VF212_02955 [Longimicrobiales bacterium]
MDRDAYPTPGLDAFWEDADRDGSDEDPLERELCDRLDALARYRRMIAEAQVNGQDDATERLLEQHEREERIAQRIADAIQRQRDRDADP